MSAAPLVPVPDSGWLQTEECVVGGRKRAMFSSAAAKSQPGLLLSEAKMCETHAVCWYISLEH